MGAVRHLDDGCLFPICQRNGLIGQGQNILHPFLDELHTASHALQQFFLRLVKGDLHRICNALCPLGRYKVFLNHPPGDRVVRGRHKLQLHRLAKLNAAYVLLRDLRCHAFLTAVPNRHHGLPGGDGIPLGIAHQCDDPIRLCGQCGSSEQCLGCGQFCIDASDLRLCVLNSIVQCFNGKRVDLGLRRLVGLRL